jgi:hypothetical protein
VSRKAEKARLAALWEQVDERELRAAEDFLVWCRTQLGLPHWYIYIGTTGPCPDDAYADCEVNPTRYLAKVRLGRAWLEIGPWAQANALIHETLHVSHHRLTEGVHIEVRNALPSKDQRAFNVIEARSDLEAERMVDRLATALTESLGAVKAWKRIRKAHGLKA